MKVWSVERTEEGITLQLKISRTNTNTDKNRVQLAHGENKPMKPNSGQQSPSAVLTPSLARDRVSADRGQHLGAPAADSRGAAREPGRGSLSLPPGLEREELTAVIYTHLKLCSLRVRL